MSDGSCEDAMNKVMPVALAAVPLLAMLSVMVAVP
jgi:hypothetical protein